VNETFYRRALLRDRLSQPTGRGRSADPECAGDGRAPLDPAAGFAGQHRPHDAPDAPDTRRDVLALAAGSLVLGRVEPGRSERDVHTPGQLPLRAGSPTPTGFRVYVRWSDGSALTPAQANSLQWHINWLGVEG